MKVRLFFFLVLVSFIVIGCGMKAPIPSETFEKITLHSLLLKRG